MVGPPSLCITLDACDLLPSLGGSLGTSFGGSVGSSLAHDAAGAVLGAITSDLTSAAAWLIGHLLVLVVGAGQVRLDAPWFAGRLQVMLQLLGFVVLPLLLAATIGPLLRQDLRRIVRVWGVGLPVALLAGTVGVQFTQLAIGATDALTAAILGSSKTALSGDLRGLAAAMAMPGAPQLVVALISLLLVLGAVLLWMELVVRAAAIYVAVFFMPLALACYVWPATASIAKRTVELLAALILSKFVIVATLTLGAAALHGGPSPDNAVIGATILLLAGFAPFSLLRLAPVVEAGAIAHLEGLSHRPFRVAGRAATQVAAAPAHPVAGMLLSSRVAAAQPPAASAVRPQPLPERPADYPMPGQEAPDE
jgi:hypothetical protein